MLNGHQLVFAIIKWCKQWKLKMMNQYKKLNVKINPIN